MHVRRKPGTIEKLLSYRPLYIEDARAHKGNWRSLFENPENPLHLEVGSGKGRFITGMAKNHPEINFIAFETIEEVLLRALETYTAGQEEIVPENVRFVWCNADYLLDVFEDNEVNGIYLNFSDPWPKKRHFKRRLTAEGYLEKYKRVLMPKGEIHLKTDNADFFEFSVEQLEKAGFFLKNRCDDLHQSDFQGNVMTEYEEKFSGLGFPIHRIEAVNP